LRAAPRHRPIASLWRARLSIALTRESFGLTLYVTSNREIRVESDHLCPYHIRSTS
jgi:hypothetical protein